MIRPSFRLMALVGFSLLLAPVFAETPVIPTSVPEPWRSYIQQDPLMAIGEGAIFQAVDDTAWVIMGVGTCAFRSGNSEDRLRCLRVAQSRALRALVKIIHGASIESWLSLGSILKTHTSSTSSENDSSEYLQTSFESIRMMAEGRVNGLPLVASWVSPDGKLFCIAIGEIAPIELK